jgi:hypothetical protein
MTFLRHCREAGLSPPQGVSDRQASLGDGPTRSALVYSDQKCVQLAYWTQQLHDIYALADDYFPTRCTQPCPSSRFASASLWFHTPVLTLRHVLRTIMSNREVRCLINCAFPCVSHASGRIGQPYDTWTLCYLKIPLMLRDRQVVDSLRLRRLCATSCNFYTSFFWGPRMLANYPQLCSNLPNSLHNSRPAALQCPLHGTRGH